MDDEHKLQELLAERNLLDAVLENVAALVIVLDREGRICRFNRACEQLSGYSFEEVVGKTPWDTVLPSEDARTIREQGFEALKNNPEALVGFYLNYWESKTGERYLIEWKNTPLRNTKGEFEYVVSLGTDVTAQHAMQAALQESEARYRSVIDAMSEGIVIQQADGQIIACNSAAEEILGLTVDQLRGRTAMDPRWQSIREDGSPFPDEEHPGTMSLRTGEMFNNVIMGVKHPEKGLRWISINSRALRKPDDEKSYASVASFADITERKLAEEALRNSEARLNEAQRIAHIGGWELDLVNNKLYWTDEIFNMFEIDKAHFGASYEAFLNAIHPEDRDVVNTAYSNSLKTRSPYDIAHRLLMQDGRIKWVNERCESFFDDEGKPVRSIGTVQDITDRVRYEQELQELNQSLERRVSDRTFELASERNFISTVLDTANALVVVLDRDGKVVRFNRACELLTGYRQKEIQGQIPWEVLVPEEQRDTVQRTFNNILADGKCTHYELEWLTRGGEHRLIDWSNSTIKDRKGDIEYIIETGIDVTERKIAELALIQARDKAEQASHAKSEFLSRMSHELRTPLNAILGFSQLLESDMADPLNPEQHENVTEIIQAGNHLLELINEILDLARIESGRIQLVMEPVALDKIIHTSVSLVQSLAEQRNVKLVIEPLPIPSLTVSADPVRLKQVVINLLSNAIKYNKVGGSVHVLCRLVNERDICLSVTDTGDGIAEGQQQKLFKPFERLDADNKAIPGTGIGLALSKRLMEMMDGSIGVSSEMGRGSTFWIILSRAE